MINFISAFIMFSLTLPSTIAFAHAHLTTASPAQDSLIETAPKEVTLQFSEELEIVMCKVTVKNLKTGEIVSQGTPIKNGEDKSSLKIALKPFKDKKAEYEVSWKVVSLDSHKMSGNYKFTFDSKVK